MKITVLGCGNAFSNKSYNQSFLLEENGERMLIDCGMQTPQALTNAGYKPADINDIYISHLHADHIGGLEYFAFLRYDWTRRPRVWNQFDNPSKYASRLIGNSQLLSDAWDKSLRGGLESMEGFVATLDTFFQPVYIEPNVPFEWNGWAVNLIQQIHIMSGSIITPSFGIMFSQPGHKTVYFVTDSQHCSPRQMEEYYRTADIIFQDTECTGINFKFAEGTQVYKDKDGNYHVWPDGDNLAEIAEIMALGYQPETWGCSKYMSGVHANYCQLANYQSANSVRLSDAIRSKMWLSHYQDFVLAKKDMYGNDIDWEAQAKKDGFAGFASVGQTFEI